MRWHHSKASCQVGQCHKSIQVLRTLLQLFHRTLELSPHNTSCLWCLGHLYCTSISVCLGRVSALQRPSKHWVSGLGAQMKSGPRLCDWATWCGPFVPPTLRFPASLPFAEDLSTNFTCPKLWEQDWDYWSWKGWRLHLSRSGHWNLCTKHNEENKTATTYCLVIHCHTEWKWGADTSYCAWLVYSLRLTSVHLNANIFLSWTITFW